MTDIPSPELARQVLVEPLLTLLRPRSIVVCATAEAAAVSAPPTIDARVASCVIADFGEVLDEANPDVVWLTGRPTWHSLRALAPVLTAHARKIDRTPPVVVVEGGHELSAQPERTERTKAGIRLALASLGTQLDAEGRAIWFAPGRGVGVFVPADRLGPLGEWLEERQALLTTINALHDRNVQLDARSLALFELLDQSQQNAIELVRSLRFRLGTRLVRFGRRAMRRERIFRAPVEVLNRKRQVAQWRARFAEERSTGYTLVAPDALAVTYIVPELRLAGGVLAVLELITELRLAGVDARVVAVKDRRHEMFGWRLATRAKVYGSREEVAQRMKPTDIVVATHWQTAAAARAVVDAGRARHAVYFMQDYEPWFVPEADRDGRDRVRATFGLLPHRIVTSEWLRQRIADDGYDAHTISLGTDLGFFYPRPVAAPERPVVFAMARPRTPRRGFETLVDALRLVHDALPQTEIVLFGEDLIGVELPFPYRAEGIITDHERLAQRYSEARVYVDVSDYQAFGLPTIEAMACGTTAVVTDVGGVQQYARPEDNCLTVRPRDPAAAADAIIRVLTDDDLAARLREGALATSARLSMTEVAQRTRETFEKINTGSTP